MVNTDRARLQALAARMPAIPPVLAVTLPLGRPDRYWNQIRLLLGLAFLAAAAWVYTHGATAGLVVRCAADGCALTPGL